MSSKPLIYFPCWLGLILAKHFEYLYLLLVRFETKFPVASHTCIFLLPCIPNHNRSKFRKFGRIKSIWLIVLRSPTIKSYFKKFSERIFLNNVPDPPIAYIVLSIYKICDIIDIPYFFCDLSLLHILVSYVYNKL